MINGALIIPALPHHHSSSNFVRKNHHEMINQSGAKSSHSSPKQQSARQLPHGSTYIAVEGRAFWDYANGGHEQSDAQLEAIAAAEEARQRQRKADEAMEAALFGIDKPDQNSSGSSMSSSTLENGGSTEDEVNMRKKRKETWNPVQPEKAVSEAPILSLLDL